VRGHSIGQREEVWRGLRLQERLRSKTLTAQVNEVLCKVLCHNICCLIQSSYELGVEPAFWNEPTP
jgi:hypothetical protein